MTNNFRVKAEKEKSVLFNSFSRGQWVSISEKSVKDVAGVPIHQLARVGQTGETYGYYDPATGEIQTLCRLTSGSANMRPAVGKLGPIVALDHQVPSVICAIGGLNQQMFFHQYQFSGRDIVKQRGSHADGFISADLVGLFLCHVSNATRRRGDVSSANKYPDCLMLNLVFKPSAVLSDEATLKPRLLETAPYILAYGQDEVKRLWHCRVIIHARRVIITTSPSETPSYSEWSETEVELWGDLIRDIVAYIELDLDDKRLPVNVCPQLDFIDSSIGGMGAMGAYSCLPAGPTWRR
jgi:hypothetical protein